eukprot:1536324-Karenia_brevis.AAC.1
MRKFTKGTHDGVILDDVRDVKFIIDHQDKVQGKYDSLIEFASTPGGGLSYELDLYAVPFVLTMNYDTKNRQLLEESDWLSKRENVVLVQWPPPQPTGLDVQHQ